MKDHGLRSRVLSICITPPIVISVRSNAGRCDHAGFLLGLPFAEGVNVPDHLFQQMEAGEFQIKT
jgi:hypothetical protein